MGFKVMEGHVARFAKMPNSNILFSDNRNVKLVSKTKQHITQEDSEVFMRAPLNQLATFSNNLPMYVEGFYWVWFGLLATFKHT